jgi:hypothetical protein
MYLDKVNSSKLDRRINSNISEKYIHINNYCLDTKIQVWLAITIPAKGKLLLKIDGGERYAAATWLRHHEIHNILKIQ